MTVSYLTSQVPGIGGQIKETPADFQVTEIPLYEPCGSGEHTYALVEKEGLTTLELLHRLARELGIAERELGYAGMKDARGITRQTVSSPRVAPERLLGLTIPKVRILSAVRHGNKLRLGHLAGNRFRIRIREPLPGTERHAEATLAILATRGVPNFFGQQRYGVQGNSHLIGLALLRGDHQGAITALIGSPDAVHEPRWQEAIIAFQAGHLAESLALFPGHCRTERELVRRLCQQPTDWQRAWRGVHPRLVSLYLSACQSALFDRVLAARLDTFDQVLIGDIAYKHANGACFLVDDATEAAPRAASFDISATGPLFGARMLAPQGESLAREEAVLTAAGLTGAEFGQAGPACLNGERRPLRVPLGAPQLTGQDGDLVVEFDLPKGSYATVVLREMMKSPAMDSP
jgi:tRNA pseudouridine13 synthase